MVVGQQEEVGAAMEELHGEGAGRRSPDGVVGAADAQDRDGCFIHLPEGVVAIPVSVPGDRVPLGLAEEGFLEFPERATPEQPACLHNLCQSSDIPRRDKGNRQGRTHMERLCPHQHIAAPFWMLSDFSSVSRWRRVSNGCHSWLVALPCSGSGVGAPESYLQCLVCLA
uniref:Uncharacterized protein n=1 Tax=Chrysemys picta bellii TaxID=8478 RepID=A0A8C3I5P0_CHRPI